VADVYDERRCGDIPHKLLPQASGPRPVESEAKGCSETTHHATKRCTENRGKDHRYQWSKDSQQTEREKIATNCIYLIYLYVKARMPACMSGQWRVRVVFFFSISVYSVVFLGRFCLPHTPTFPITLPASVVWAPASSAPASCPTTCEN